MRGGPLARRAVPETLYNRGSMAPSPRPTLLQSLAVFLPGLVLMVLSSNRAVAVFESTDPDPSMAPVIALTVGAILFAIGFMMTLVALFRPLFSKRTVDTIVDEYVKGQPPGPR